MKHYLSLFVSLVFCWTSLHAQKPISNYEFRAVWVATVENIDWPSKRGLSVEDQKVEFIRLADMHQRLGMNALIVQIRPVADAFFPSSYEPWSEYLTGKQGAPPVPYYDPLAFMIEETHKRGMEFHAWLNPYRAVFNINKSSIAPSHITKIHPEWFVTYGDKKYFDPGIPEVRRHVVNVVKDLLNRYPLDGIHMDDYFYPYKIAGKEFPDQKSFQQYGRGMKRDDWRRSNCDSIIKNLYEAIRATNPSVKFGISPFGVWRNKDKDPMGSNTRAGQTNYDDLYADILLWLKNGWMDYVLPQLYWERGFNLADYDILLDWWNEHSYGRHLYIGHGIYRAGAKGGWSRREELPEQIQLLRKFPTTHGSAYFSSKSFNNNPNGWNDSLKNNYYARPAIIPPMPWVDATAPDAPKWSLKGDILQMKYEGAEAIKGYVVYHSEPGKGFDATYTPIYKIYPGKGSLQLNLKELIIPINNHIWIAALDRNNNISDPVKIR